MYYVYILICADGTLYSGIARDVAARVHAHNESPAGAKYTRARRPVRLAYVERKKNRSTAQMREAALKKLARSEKLALIAAFQEKKETPKAPRRQSADARPLSDR